ncbi:aromatic amino acid transport family protein [Corynebacterium cystitidis]|uniref:Amino acid permease n=1 Tax=Corynebacterium cystitidis DSM 20524 TaxID=1121357 RepID=A0A1H9QNJ1_9CORY|nr:amino acid permease [Corynebacterium cystitidis]WJY81715.1 Tyrosine-specific transport protein [Corynebacterium cystitidis DSM 20524]SER62008.1 Amino acid permease [Corynebacterium cystitidis DSM 20524]SNV84573.1 putative amino acid permease [Corynebacterium cystitidis]
MNTEISRATRNVNANQEHKDHRITLLQGVAIIFGTNIGAGILSIPYASKDGGFLTLCLALIIAGSLTSFSMLYVAEVALRTEEPFQLSGLAEKYLGELGRWLVFVAIIVNGFGALIAYASGSGNLLDSLFQIPPTIGTLIFFAVGCTIMWMGLQATGAAESAITIGMALIIGILCGWTFFGPGIKINNLLVFNPAYLIPIMNLAVFTFLAQYVVPELARGLRQDNPRAIPKAIVVGMCLTGFILALVPFAALGLLGIEVTEVITIAWGNELGPVAYYLANVFALFAILTSFIAIGFTTMRNILDIFHWPEFGWQRVVAVSCTGLIPLLIFFAGLNSFVDALTYAGGFAGAIVSIVPVFLLRVARKRGDRQPEWQATWQASSVIQVLIVVVYSCAFVFSVLSVLGFEL